MAPIGIRAPMRDASPELTTVPITEGGSVSIGNTGDVHARPVPTQNGPKATGMRNESDSQSLVG
jgi:hypothetical protein